MDKLNNLRRDSYVAASIFLLAEGDFFSSLQRGSKSEPQKALTGVCTAAAAYKTALDNLVAYLSAQAQIDICEAELVRTLELAKILERELAALEREQSA